MKEFNLDAALNGEPVVLRGGRKAFVLCDLKQYFKNPISDKHLIGITSQEKDPNSFAYSLRWYDSGAYSVHMEDECDIIGMWEDPKINIEDLPKPFKPKGGDGYYYICGRTIEYMPKYIENSNFDRWSAKNGQCFRTKEDAQKWIDFMKSMME